MTLEEVIKRLGEVQFATASAKGFADEVVKMIKKGEKEREALQNEIEKLKQEKTKIATDIGAQKKSFDSFKSNELSEIKKKKVHADELLKDAESKNQSAKQALNEATVSKATADAKLADVEKIQSELKAKAEKHEKAIASLR